MAGLVHPVKLLRKSEPLIIELHGWWFNFIICISKVYWVWHVTCYMLIWNWYFNISLQVLSRYYSLFYSFYLFGTFFRMLKNGYTSRGCWSPGYRFTKGLTQNLNLRTNWKLKYNIKSLNYIQPNFRFQASFLYYWTMSFTFSTWSVV